MTTKWFFDGWYYKDTAGINRMISFGDGANIVDIHNFAKRRKLSEPFYVATPVEGQIYNPHIEWQGPGWYIYHSTNMIMWVGEVSESKEDIYRKYSLIKYRPKIFNSLAEAVYSR